MVLTDPRISGVLLALWQLSGTWNTSSTSTPSKLGTTFSYPRKDIIPNGGLAAPGVRIWKGHTRLHLHPAVERMLRPLGERPESPVAGSGILHRAQTGLRGVRCGEVAEVVLVLLLHEVPGEVTEEG